MARRAPSDINLLIAIDKPVGITSQGAVSRVRRALDERRVGHAGTLDPLASGVLVVGVGQGTRVLGLIAQDRKRYLARILFGTETSTDDAEGEIVRSVEPVPELLDEERAREVLEGFMGPQMQVPPAYSAISVDGRRSYARARAGEEVELEPRPVEVYAADLIGVEDAGEGPVWTVSFEVSKGTYIRSLARDIGRAVGGAAHLAELRRTASGSVTLGACLPLEGLSREAAREGALDPVRVLGLPACLISEAALADVLNGRALDAGDVAFIGEAPEEGGRAAVVRGGELCAIAELEGGRLRMKTVFPQGIGGVR